MEFRQRSNEEKRSAIDKYLIGGTTQTDSSESAIIRNNVSKNIERENK